MIRSTFLVGFPGETEADFRTLRDFQDAAELDWLGAFAYSREEGTTAFDMKARVPAKTAKARKKAVEEAQERITPRRLARFVGRVLDVLVEERVAIGTSDGAAVGTSDGAAVGSTGGAAVRTPGDVDGAEELSLGRAWLQAPDVDGLVVLRGDYRPGSLVRARVLAVNGVDLDAIGIDPPPLRPGRGPEAPNARRLEGRPDAPSGPTVRAAQTTPPRGYRGLIRRALGREKNASSRFIRSQDIPWGSPRRASHFRQIGMTSPRNRCSAS